jgi:hypothetical protein
MQMWGGSGNIEVVLDDLFLIIGPNLNSVSHDESFEQEGTPEGAYDESNMYNIFEHQLKIRKKNQGNNLSFKSNILSGQPANSKGSAKPVPLSSE